jgi:hypothetical protein
MPVTEFKLKQHSIRAIPIVEVWYNGKFRATITPGDEDQPSFRVTSSHIREVQRDVGDVLGDMFQFVFFED